MNDHQRQLESFCPGLSTVQAFLVKCVTRGDVPYGTLLEATAKDYKSYLTSDHWILTRRVVLILYGSRCAVCGSSSSLDVHHRSYEFICRERLIDLVVLCRTCHGIVHKLRERHNDMPNGAFASKRPEARDILRRKTAEGSAR